MISIFHIGKDNICSYLTTVCFQALFFLLVSTTSLAFEQSHPNLQDDDCKKCHLFQQETINAAGGKHATEVACLDCHPQHIPKGKDTISACDLCHSGQPHFQTDECLVCHADPHKPLASLRDTDKPARKECLSCHAEVGLRMSAATSRHATLFCNRCHTRHGFIPSCLDCHEPHLPSQTGGDCLRCHKAHSPIQVEPARWVPAAFCQVCHIKEGRDLADTTSNHGVINCIYCHKGLHPSSPTCQECHGLPHARSLHSKYRQCLTDCHGDAHLLIGKQ